jgi:hypothetical protein
LAEHNLSWISLSYYILTRRCSNGKLGLAYIWHSQRGYFKWQMENCTSIHTGPLRSCKKGNIWLLVLAISLFYDQRISWSKLSHIILEHVMTKFCWHNYAKNLCLKWLRVSRRLIWIPEVARNKVLIFNLLLIPWD